MIPSQQSAFYSPKTRESVSDLSFQESGVDEKRDSDIFSHSFSKLTTSKNTGVLRQDVLTKKILKVCRDLLLRDLQSLSGNISFESFDPSEGISGDVMR